MILQPMSIYYCSYGNWHNDPNPVLWVFHSTSAYTEGLNIRYLPSSRRMALFRMIRQLLGVGGGRMAYNGRMIYEIIKRNYPDFAKISYRKYFSTYLTGTVVNKGLSPFTPLMALYLKVNSMVGRTTSNYLQTRARADMVVKELNKVLFDRAAKNMLDFANIQTGYNPSAGGTPPGAITPGQLPPSSIRGNTPQTPQTPQGPV